MPKHQMSVFKPYSTSNISPLQGFVGGYLSKSDAHGQALCVLKILEGEIACNQHDITEAGANLKEIKEYEKTAKISVASTKQKRLKKTITSNYLKNARHNLIKNNLLRNPVGRSRSASRQFLY